jgi:acyl carrier protein
MHLTREALLGHLESARAIDVSQIESDDAELFSSGLLDSFAMADLMQFIEEIGGFEISPEDVTLENFDSVNRILAYAGSRGA